MVANTAALAIDPHPLLLNVADLQLQVTVAEFDRLCQHNPDLRLELMGNGELVVMAPAGGDSSRRNFDLAGQVWLWNRQTNLGEAFDSSGGYDFVAWGGGKLSPDVSWIEGPRLEGVDITGFIPLVPDFVIELRSATDSLSKLQEKMREYQRLGVKLGLLIDPQHHQVEVYRFDRAVEILASPQVVDCGAVMPGFSLSLERIW
jgi:Uma2 family endonuclease